MATPNFGLPETPDTVKISQLAAADRALAVSVDNKLGGVIADAKAAATTAAGPAVTTALADADVLRGGENRSPRNGESDSFSIQGTNGLQAFEVDRYGRTHIYDPLIAGPKVTILHAFLAVGQSNMSGRGLPISPVLDKPNERILQFGSKVRTLRQATVPLDMHDTALGLSPATVFAEEYLKTQPANVGVLLIPAAHGGTGFTTSTTELTWTKGAATDPSLALYELSVTQTLAGLAAARAAGYGVELKAVLWHQGENNGSASTATMTSWLSTLHTNYKTDLGNPTLSMVVGQMSAEGIATATGRENINKAHTDFPAVAADRGFAPSPSTGGTNAGDATHFSRDGITFLGKSYLTGYWQANSNINGAAPLPPVNAKAVRTGSRVRVTWDAPPRALTSTGLMYDTDNGGMIHNWTTVPSRIVRYDMSVSTDGTTWAAVARNHPTYLWQEFINTTVTKVRITSYLNSTNASSVIIDIV